MWYIFDVASVQSHIGFPCFQLSFTTDFAINGPRFRYLISVACKNFPDDVKVTTKYVYWLTISTIIPAYANFWNFFLLLLLWKGKICVLLTFTASLFMIQYSYYLIFNLRISNTFLNLILKSYNLPMTFVFLLLIKISQKLVLNWILLWDNWIFAPERTVLILHKKKH